MNRLLLLNVLFAGMSVAQTAQEAKPRTGLPPGGIEISAEDRMSLSGETAALGKEVEMLKAAKGGAKEVQALIPDAEIFQKAVDWALRYDEFYSPKDVQNARALLAEGKARVAALKEGKAPWATATGLVVRGYRSSIDGSVQPIGIVVPKDWKGKGDTEVRPLWIWNHGRNDKLSELSFMNERMRRAGEFAPAEAFVIHPYGRYCNATKFAGEIDVFEAMEAASQWYGLAKSPRINAGFSMGGASAWHLSVHHAGIWAASHAGAGFAETAEYAKVFGAGKTPPPWWEQTLWRWYDATVYAANLQVSPMLSYHGSEDKQGQATEIMKRFAEKEGVTFETFVGPGVAHKYEPKTKADIAVKLEKIASEPRSPRLKGTWTTYTPFYGGSQPVEITSLEKMWERADVKFDFSVKPVTIQTRNVAELRVEVASPGVIEIDGKKVDVPAGKASGWLFSKGDTGWSLKNADDTLVKSEVLKKDATVCGPIDHAFMSSFLFVRPTGKPLNAALATWTERELAHAIEQWRGIFRGDVRVKADSEVTDKEIQTSNLVLWGDPSSNSIFKRVLGSLPIRWDLTSLELGGKKYNPASHVPILIYPNPLSPRRYIVLNSGFTFNRAAASGTNSQQTPKLPDWAIVDITVPPDDKYPGKVEEAGFFDRNWKVTNEQPK